MRGRGHPRKPLLAVLTKFKLKQPTCVYEEHSSLGQDVLWPPITALPGGVCAQESSTAIATFGEQKPSVVCATQSVPNHVTPQPAMSCHPIRPLRTPLSLSRSLAIVIIQSSVPSAALRKRLRLSRSLSLSLRPPPSFCVRARACVSACALTQALASPRALRPHRRDHGGCSRCGHRARQAAHALQRKPDVENHRDPRQNQLSGRAERRAAGGAPRVARTRPRPHAPRSSVRALRPHHRSRGCSRSGHCALRVSRSGRTRAQTQCRESSRRPPGPTWRPGAWCAAARRRQSTAADPEYSTLGRCRRPSRSRSRDPPCN